MSCLNRVIPVSIGLVKAKLNSPLSRVFRNYVQWLIFVFACFSISCSSVQKSGETVLAPTPEVLTVQEIEIVRDLKRKNLKQSFPVFICSSRNLLDHQRGVNPFGNKRSHTFVPYLAVANVSLGQGVTEQQVRYESVSKVKRKQSRMKVESLKMYASPVIDPSSTDAEKKRELRNNKWLGEIRTHLNDSKRKNITVFVHGYNTHLVENTELLGELYHYGGRNGVVINYEWPSAGKLLGYFQDKGNAEYSSRLFRSFVSRLAATTGAENIRVIAHSAGTPIVVSALKELRLINQKLTKSELHKKYKISQVILAAPDMDAMRFMNAVFDDFADITPSVSVYSSSKDRALRVSSKLFGVKRLGNAIDHFAGWEKKSLVRSESIRLIDVSVAHSIFGSLLGHSYFHRDPWVSSDILLSMQEKNPLKRGLVKEEGALFYSFPKDYTERLGRLKNIR